MKEIICFYDKKTGEVLDWKQVKKRLDPIFDKGMKRLAKALDDEARSILFDNS